MRAPYRLDLTVQALRRLSTNVVDVLLPDGRYVRAFPRDDGADVIEVRQVASDAIEVRVIGRDARDRIETVARMLGTDVDLRVWYRRAKAFPWLDALARRFRGVKPPRYPELWEALCHGVIFQQLSLQAGAAIMQRMVERFAEPVQYENILLYPFPRPERLVDAAPRTLRAIGLSSMKGSYLKSIAQGVLEGTVRAETIESLPTAAASAELSRLRGIGAWSASLVLLRGFGRLDVFPLRDAGAVRSAALLSGDRHLDLHRVLDELDGVRGMLYFHLLLGRLHPRET